MEVHYICQRLSSLRSLRWVAFLSELNPVYDILEVHSLCPEATLLLLSVRANSCISLAGSN